MRTKYSEVLKQNITIDDEHGKLTTDDGATYNRSELLLLKDSPDSQKYLTHQFKRIFNGTVVG